MELNKKHIPHNSLYLIKDEYYDVIRDYITRVYLTKKGYYRGYDKRVKKFKLLHNLIYEYYYGAIPDGMQIHHKDQNKLNNRIENLQLVSPLEHKRIHSGCFEENGVWYKKCTNCKETKSFDEFYRINKGKWIHTWCKECCIKNAVENKRKRKLNRKRGKEEKICVF